MPKRGTASTALEIGAESVSTSVPNIALDRAPLVVVQISQGSSSWRLCRPECRSIEMRAIDEGSLSELPVQCHTAAQVGWALSLHVVELFLPMLLGLVSSSIALFTWFNNVEHDPASQQQRALKNDPEKAFEA
eukprot:5991465-Amphidinium_carterae.1